MNQLIFEECGTGFEHNAEVYIFN